MTAIPYPIPARHKGFNRAEIVDQNFTEFVQLWQGEVHTARGDDAPVLPGSRCNARGFRELFESQLISRHLDLMARVLRVQNKVFYTIGSSGHEGNAMVARLTRHTDPAFLHYRSGAIHGRALPQAARHGSGHGFRTVASRPARTTRHRAAATRCGAASRCGCCRRRRRSPRICRRRSVPPSPSSRRGASAHKLPIPDDSIAICSFGDASSNHATAQTAFNAAAVDGLPEAAGAGAVRLRGQRHRHLGEDADRLDGERISAIAPTSIISSPMASISPTVTTQVAHAVEHCRTTRRPTFLHLKTTRIMGHAGTDFEIEWRSVEELFARRGQRSAAAFGGDRARLGPLYEGIAAREVRGHAQAVFRSGGRRRSAARS